MEDNSLNSWKYNIICKLTENIKNIENHFHIFENFSVNAKIDYIKIHKIKKKDLNLKEISIHLRYHKYKVIKILDNLIKLCNKEAIIYKPENLNLIILECKGKIPFEEIIYYLDKIEEIPLYFLKKLLSLGGNYNNYPRILKNKGSPNLKKINFIILSKLDREYYDNLINLLDFNQKIEILKYNKLNTFEFNYNLLNDLVKTDLDMIQIKELVETIMLLSKINIKFDKIYENTNIFFEYLNYLSIDDILKELKGDKIIYNRAFEMINYLYILSDLSLSENIKLVKIINDKYSDKDLILLKNKLLCKIISNNTNLDNDVFKELKKYEDSFEGIITLLLSIRNKG